MAFFNKKQEVIDIQLTPYGDQLLSTGKFSPTYYAFFDDDILYDGSGSAGISEVQNSVEGRIQEDTPNPKTQYIFRGVERTLTPHIAAQRAWLRMTTFATTGDGSPTTEALQSFVSTYASGPYFDEDDAHRALDMFFYASPPPAQAVNATLMEPLGSMNPGSEYVPSWDIKVLNGELSGAVNYLTSSEKGPLGETSGLYSNVKRIPQLDFDITYRVLVGNTAFIDIDTGLRDRMISSVFEDGTFLYLSEDAPNLMLSIDEQHVSDAAEYDIEVYSIANGSQGVETVLLPLSFKKKPPKIVNDILLDERSVPLPDLQALDPSYAEYFFQVNADFEIAEEEICPKIASLADRGFVVEDIPYNCPDVRKVGLLDIYGTNIVEGDVEVCDDD